MKTKNSHIAVYFVVFLVLALAVSTIKTAEAAITPTSDTQTLMSSLTPEEATLGQTIDWLVWTDPSLSGQIVTLTITDLNDHTALSGYPKNITLGTPNGSRRVTVSTVGLTTHKYQFKASTTSGNMKLVSSRYQDFELPTYSVFMSYSPSSGLLPGDTVDLTLFESPDLDAVANVTFRNSTKIVQSWPNIAIPASNGSRIIKGISTAGLKAGNYEFRVNATSSIGKDITSTPLTLSDIIVEVEELFYIVGDPVNVTIRTYPTVSQANLSMALFNFTIFDQTFFKDEEVTLTNGRAEKLYDSTSWPVDRRGKTIIYSANVNASVSGRTVEDQASFFLDVFSVDVDTDKNSYLPGQMVEVTTTTEPSQAGGTLTLRVSNSSSDIVKTIGPSAIGADGTSTSTIDTTGWPVDEYDIEASVIKGNYMRNDTGSFDIYLRTFNIFATLDAFSYSDFAMPALTISTTPGQTNSNLTLTVDGPGGEYYEFTKTEFDSTTYLYGVPLLKQPNGTDTITVQITSSTGTNDTSATPATLFYRHSPDLVVVSEPFLLQTLLLLGSSPIFYYAAKKRRQRQ